LPVLQELPVHQPATAQVAHRQAGVILQRGHIVRCATAGQIRGAGHRHPAQRPQWPRDDALVGDDAGAQRGIEAFLDQIDQAVAEHGFHLQLRMLLQQRRQHRHQHLAPEHRRRADLQRARGRARAVGQLPLGIVQAGQQRCHLFDELAAIRGQRHVAGVPLQQLHPSVASSRPIARDRPDWLRPSCPAATVKLRASATCTSMRTALRSIEAPFMPKIMTDMVGQGFIDWSHQ
jgi:hypothetical protein